MSPRCAHASGGHQSLKVHAHLLIGGHANVTSTIPRGCVTICRVPLVTVRSSRGSSVPHP